MRGWRGWFLYYAGILALTVGMPFVVSRPWLWQDTGYTDTQNMRDARGWWRANVTDWHGVSHKCWAKDGTEAPKIWVANVTVSLTGNVTPANTTRSQVQWLTTDEDPPTRFSQALPPEQFENRLRIVQGWPANVTQNMRDGTSWVYTDGTLRGYTFAAGGVGAPRWVRLR